MQMKKKQQQVNKHKPLPTNAQNREGLIKRKSVIRNKLRKFTNISRNEKKRITRDYEMFTKLPLLWLLIT